MKKAPFIGSGVALITPFNDTTVNYRVLEELIEYQIANNTDAIIICGTTGEPATMTESEKKEVIRFTVEKVNKRIPVIAGTGSNCTKTAIEMSKYAQSVGTDGVLVVTPYYNKTTQVGLMEHYKKIANSINIPLIMYNVPSRTGLNLTVDTVYQLSKIENIVAVKEASGNFSQIVEIANKCGDNMHIYSGNDDQIVPMLSLGAVGVISVLANVAPNQTHQIVKKYLDGKVDESKKLQLELLPLINALFTEVNPIPVKEAVNLIGFEAGKVRLPLVGISESNKEVLVSALKHCMII